MIPILATAPTWWLAAGCTMLHVLWLGALIGLFALAGRRLLRSAPLRLTYVFTLSCLLVLVAAPATLFVRVADRMQERPAGAALLPGDPMDEEEDLAALIGDAVPISHASEGTSPFLTPTEAASSWLDAVASWTTTLSAILPWIWAAGAAAGLGLVAIGIRRARRLNRQAVRLRDEPPGRLCDRLARRFELRHVEVAVSEDITSPMLIGVRRPVILLPPAAKTWRPDQLEMVLLHELWHVRRRDNLVNLLQCVIESLMFFHPAVWRISHWLRIDRENCCDSAVLAQTRQPLAYARLLAALAIEQRSPRRVALAMGEHNLVGRIRHVLGREPRSPYRLGAAMAWMLLAVSVSMSAAVLYFRSDWVVVPIVAAPDENTRNAADPDVSITPAGAQPPVQTAERSPRAIGPSAADAVTLQIVDGTGRPVHGARAGIRIKWTDQDTDWPIHSAPFVSDADGIIRITSKKLVAPTGPGGCDPFAPCFVFNESLGLAGALNLSLKDWGRTVQVVLQPVTRVRFELAGPDSADNGEPVAWTKGFVRLFGNRLSYLLRKTQPELSTFEYLLPPGQYELLAMAGTGTDRASVVHVQCFTVPANTKETYLGLIKLEPAPDRSSPDTSAARNPAPDPAIAAAAGFGSSVPPPADSETRGSWWENSNP